MNKMPFIFIFFMAAFPSSFLFAQNKSKDINDYSKIIEQQIRQRVALKEPDARIAIMPFVYCYLNYDSLFGQNSHSLVDCMRVNRSFANSLVKVNGKLQYTGSMYYGHDYEIKNIGDENKEQLNLMQLASKKSAHCFFFSFFYEGDLWNNIIGFFENGQPKFIEGRYEIFENGQQKWIEDSNTVYSFEELITHRYGSLEKLKELVEDKKRERERAVK